MDIDPRNFFNLLYQYLEDGSTGAKHCNQQFINLNEILTREQVNLPDADLYLQCLFHKTQGLLNIVAKIVNKKEYKSSIKTIFEIIHTLINNFPTKMGKYIPNIYEICFKVVKSSLVSADEKGKALDVLVFSFEKINKCFDFPECYNEVYNNLVKVTSVKKSNTALAKVLRALGSFAKHFQYLVTNPGVLKSIFLNALETQMISNDFSNGVVCGAFTGLEWFCESFPFEKDSEDVTVINKIYKYIDKLVIPTSTIKIANRAALSFLGSNMSLFLPLMLEKIPYWHEHLLTWLTYGHDDQKVGIVVLQSFYRELGNFLQRDLSQQHQEIILYFINWFKTKLSTSTTSNSEKRLCLHGLSSLSGICQLQPYEEENKAVMILLLQNFEQMFVLSREPSQEDLEALPFYLQTVAKFIHFRKITNSDVFCLHETTVLMIKVYPQLPYSCHGAVVEALVSTFYFVASNDEKIFDAFIDKVIYQGVVWSCSHQHISEAEVEEGSQSLTVKSYFTLWRKLLQIMPLHQFDKQNIFLPDRKYIVIKVTDKLMKVLLILINRLNVSIVLNSTTEPLSDIQAAYRVANNNDFAIFLNIVDFYEEVFEALDPNIFKKCACKLIHHLVLKCDKFPLVSGFYKLLSFSLKVCNKEHYFNDAAVAEDVKTCTSTLTTFADSLLIKTQQFKGDLLIACLQVLLQYPLRIIQGMLPACVPAFKTIFYVGRNYIKLAHMALDTLEQWQKEISGPEMQRFLFQIVPLFDYYLQSKSLGTFTDSNLLEERRKLSRDLRKRKVLIKTEPELVKLQMRIIQFLGGGNNALCETFAFCENAITSSRWSNQEHLKLTLPFEDTKLEIYLEKFLPRIVHVAVNHSDRKTRMIACELLQAIVMVFLGTSKQMSKSSSSDLNPLLTHVAVPLLKLGCDMDRVVEQLFRPLCFQMIHWYTHGRNSRDEHAAIFIEAVLDSITHPTDTALRDFSGKCVNEYVKWTIKQSSDKSLARDPVAIKALVKKMRFYSTHPDSFKKLGAALIFNNIYQELREHSSLVNIFWIEFLHIFVRSLSMFELGTIDDNPVSHIKSALKHIERGFIDNSKLFNSNTKDRRVPGDFEGGLLKDVAMWLLKETGSPSEYCRQICMELFCSIARETPKYATLHQFILQYYKESGWAVEIYESVLQKHPTLESIQDHEGLNPNHWLQALLCALDGYKFIITYKLVTTDDVLSESISNAISYFLNKVSVTSLQNVKGRDGSYNKFAKETFDKQRSQVAFKLLELLTILAPKIDVFYTTDLWNHIVNLIFKREALGFEGFLDASNLDSKIHALVKSFLTKLPLEKALELKQVLRNYITENLISDMDFKTYVPLRQRNVLKGLKMLMSFSLEHFLFEEFTSGMVEKLLNNFVNNAEGGIIYAGELQDNTLAYCLSVLDFALYNHEEVKSLITFLYRPHQVQVAHNKQPILWGTYLLNLFEESLLDEIMKNFEMFLNFALESNEQMMNVTTDLLLHILSHALSKKPLKHLNEIAVCKLLQNWDVFECYFNGNDRESGLRLIECFVGVLKASKQPCQNVKQWLLNLMSLEQRTSWKSELDFKAEVFYLLVDIMDDTDDDNMDLRDSLSHIKTTLSAAPTETATVFLHKLLHVIPKIQTPEIVIFLLDLYITEKSSYKLETVLKEYLIRNQQSQKVFLNKLYSLCMSDHFDNCENYKLVTSTISTFQYCNLQVLDDFFVHNIAEIMSLLKQTTTSQNVVKKICHLLLIEILFVRHPTRCVQDNEVSNIAEAAISTNPSNKKLTIEILKITLEAVKDTTQLDHDFLRLYKCHSYNTTASIVSNSLKSKSFFEKLFIRQHDNADILWTGLIDTKKVNVFQTAFESLPQRRTILVNIRNEMTKNRKQDQLESVRYLESQRVFNSSLSEDFSKFDFSNSTLRSEAKTEDVGDAKSELELEDTDINNHECMATVCGLIQLMVDTNVLELPTDEDETFELPVWINGIRSLLLNPETHNNIKIFWIKVIGNMSHIFEHFAKWFLEPLLKFLVDKCAGDCINYFVIDVVAILSAWSAVFVPTTPTEIQYASDLLGFLVTNLNNERKDMFKYHLELIKVLLESWKSITVPYELLFAKLDVDVTSRAVEVGIHLFSIWLANKRFPWDDKTIDFCKKMFEVILKSNLKSTYKPAAESVGLLLRLKREDAKLFKNVHILLKKITDKEKYAHVLECLVLHCADVVDDFHAKVLLSRLHDVPKPIKLIYLKVILNRSTLMRRIDEFKTENWNSYIENDDLEVQIMALQIVYECLDVLRGLSNFKSIVESVCSHSSNSHVLCRSRMCDILISITQSGGYPPEIVNLCKPALVQGLTDTDNEIREKVYEFWKNGSQIPIPISTRFVFILSNLYEPSIEGTFLGYSSHLLLDIIRRSEEYSNILFEHPLEDCEFEKYDLETDWRLQHLSVAPLFAETVSSASLSYDTPNTDFNKIRQTQSLKFTPTQSVREKQLLQFTASESSLLVASSEPFVNPNTISLSHKYRVPKLRFLRNKEKIQSHFAQREVKKNVEKSEKQKDLIKQRESKVTLYRSYRKGDLPDVQITLQSVVEPLQALGLYDGEISKMLFTQLFQNLLQKMKYDTTFLEQISSAIKYIFNSSTEYNRKLFAALFDVLLQSKSSIIFPTDLIVSASRFSGLKALGVVLLEEYLISHNGTAPPTKKSRGTDTTDEIHIWIKVAELYKEMGEWDAVKSIFLEKTDSPSNVKDGLAAESRQRWEEAQQHYQNLLVVDENLTKKDFYYESYFKCFANLGDWGNLVQTIDSIVTSSEHDCWDELWDDGFYQQKLMPWYMSGQLKNALFTQQSSNPFFEKLNASLNSTRSDYLQSHFCEEIAMFWIFKRDPEEAEQYLKMYMKKFLDYWQQLDHFSTNLRYNSLLKLRNIVDIQNFLLVFNNFSVDNIAKIEELVNYWNGSAYENLPSILYCEEKVLYRKQFVNLLIEKANSNNSDEEFSDVISQLTNVKFTLDQGLMDIGTKNNNFNMTKKYLNSYTKQNVLKFKLVVSKLAYIKANMLNNASEKVTILLKGCDPLKQIFESAGHASLKLEAYEHLFKELCEISDILSCNAELLDEKTPDLRKLIGVDVTSPEDVAVFGADKLKVFLGTYEKELDDQMETDNVTRSGHYQSVADAYVKLAYFVKKQRNCQFRDYMFFVLRAMKFSSSEGRQLFPCVIMEKEFDDEDTRQFIEETSTIPIWMFLGWIPQILVNVDSPKVTAVAPLLLNLAQNYPQAIMYAYRLSKENFSCQSEEAKELVNQLDTLLLSDTRISEFLTALSFVGVPASILLYHVRKILQHCHKNNTTQAASAMERLQTEIFGCEPNSHDVNSFQGNMFKGISKFQKDFKSFKGLKSGSSGTKLITQLKKIDTALTEILRNESEKNSKLLKDYCPWLANFSAHKLNLELEIPGQYDGRKMPLPHHHVKISGFYSDVRVMSSLRKPIKITVLGNDMKKHPFLAKFGEDVRQDQRIQQLFTLMNDIFDNDSSLSGRKFSILTYQVIPLSTSLGIIEWIEDTNSLQELVTKTDKDSKSSKVFGQLFETYTKFVFTNQQLAPVDAYGRAAVKYSRDKVIPKFRSLASAIEWDVLRTQFFKLSTTIENFFAMRNNFIQSYAVMCVTHWILGVGDRHLSNSLICLQNGKVLGIDFGHAFGTATQILPVPELVPFRLTPHLVSLMEPLGEKGLFREIMIHCLRSLRNNSGSLLSTMNVFIEEPTIDWLEHASKFRDNSSSSDCSWYPAQKIDQAERKLKGAKSSSVMIEDLKAGHQKKADYMNAYISLVEGAAEHDVRTRKDDHGLSVEDQVDCLIDHATDYNLLGRMFHGWAPWV